MDNMEMERWGEWGSKNARVARVGNGVGGQKGEYFRQGELM